MCTDKTGRVEAAEVEYGPSHVSYEELLDIFWKNHSPATPNRQGSDIGTQYRSAIFFHDKEQEAIPKQGVERVDQSGKFGKRQIFVEIKPDTRFYKAEEYISKNTGHCAW
jgi:peptide-methionine (S)-S-oxide reductase